MRNNFWEAWTQTDMALPAWDRQAEQMVPGEWGWGPEWERRGGGLPEDTGLSEARWQGALLREGTKARKRELAEPGWDGSRVILGL